VSDETAGRARLRERPRGQLRAAALELAERYRYPLTVWAGSRVAVYLLIAMAGWTQRQPKLAGASFGAFFGPLGGWDAGWYRWIAHYGYDPAIAHGNTPAFFPLYPLVWRAAGFVVPGPTELPATLVSSLCFAGALCLLYRMTQARYDEAMARRTVLYLAIFPLTFVFSLPYAESLFLLLSLAAFAASWHRRWWLAGALAGLAAVTRPVGIALLPALAWRIYRQEGRRPAAYLPLLPIPLALAAFYGYVAWRSGDPLAWTHAQQRGWERGVSFLPWLMVYTVWHNIIEGGQLRYVVHLGFTVLWCYLWYRLWRMRVPGEYLLYSALLVLIPTSGGLLVSMGRFGMVAFPFFWALARLGEQERVDTLVKTAAPLLLAALVLITYGPRTFTP
jgi:hypothetical protein